jgi:hypothetical protein
MPQHLYVVQIILQALSSFAIAGGLIFAAVQFLYARKAQEVANFSKLVELQMHLREMRVTDPALAYVYTHDVEGMQSDQDIRYHFMNLMQLSVFEIVWYAHRQGQLSDDYYESWVSRMREVEGEESFRRMFYSKAPKILHDDFYAFVASMIKNDGPPPPGR